MFSNMNGRSGSYNSGDYCSHSTLTLQPSYLLFILTKLVRDSCKVKILF